MTALVVGMIDRVREEDQILLFALDGRRGLSRCSCRCEPNEQCVIGTFTYDPSYDWRCGCCRAEVGTCTCPGSVRNPVVLRCLFLDNVRQQTILDNISYLLFF